MGGYLVRLKILEEEGGGAGGREKQACLQTKVLSVQSMIVLY